jgi:hypothetical protein
VTKARNHEQGSWRPWIRGAGCVGNAADHSGQHWYRVGEELLRLGLLTVVDLQPLAAYCQTYDRWRMAEEALAKIAEKGSRHLRIAGKKQERQPDSQSARCDCGESRRSDAPLCRRVRIHPSRSFPRQRRSATESKFGLLLVG